MAKIKKNSFLQGLSGSVGDMVFRQMPDGSTRVSAKSKNKARNFNREQKAYQKRFQMAQAYAKEVKTDPFYEGLALQTGRDAYHLALSDGLKPPVIHAVERIDGRVQVMASDNVMVANVQVRILDGDGKLLEGGYAAQPDPVHEPERWEYAARAEGTIEVIASDVACNSVSTREAPPASNAAARAPQRTGNHER